MKNLGLHVIKNPSGTFSFVGNVPLCLAYVGPTGAPLTEKDYEFVKDQMLLPSKYRKIECRVFQSAVGAAMIARELGYEVHSIEGEKLKVED